MTARCPFCEAVHPLGSLLNGEQIDCPCGAVAILCAPNTEPDTCVLLAQMGLGDTKADVLDDRLSIAWGREWWRRRASSAYRIDEGGTVP